MNQLIDYLKRERYLEVRGPDPLKAAANPLSLANRFALTEGGKKRAAHLLEYDAYVGPAPVSLDDYWQQVGRQSIKLAHITPPRLNQVFQGLVLSPDIVEQLGPATVSGKPLFLYGPPANGKTTIAVRLEQIWDDAILVPFALFVEGNVIRVFDEITHQPAGPDAGEVGERRWVRCRRPTVIVGGELTLGMLDLAFNPTLKYYEAPLQLKANNRLFIVDNSLAQATQWELDLFREMIPLKKKWCCPPIEDDPKVLDLAAQAGAWYVYQAIFDTSDYIRRRVQRVQERGIGVEGTIILGTRIEYDHAFIGLDPALMKKLLASSDAGGRFRADVNSLARNRPAHPIGQASFVDGQRCATTLADGIENHEIANGGGHADAARDCLGVGKGHGKSLAGIESTRDGATTGRLDRHHPG